MKHMTTTTARLFGAATLIAALGTTANAATLVSSALDASQTDLSGTNGIFTGATGADASPAVGGVTTTVVSNAGSSGINNISGPQTVRLRAVSAANGMDLTYDVTYSPFIYDQSEDTENAVESRMLGYVAVRSIPFNNTDRESTTTLLQADTTTDVEFFRVTIDNVINSGTTTYFLDGATQLRFNGLSGIAIMDTYVNGVSGTTFGSGGTNPAASGDADISLSSPLSSLAIVATDDDTTGPRANFDNRWEGLAVQFNDVPEPGSLALLGLGGLLIGVRRRRN